LRLSASKRTTHANPHNLYAVPREKSVARIKDQIRTLTQRRAPVTLRDMIEVINPIIRGWGIITGKRMSESCSIGWTGG
jgi:RNA-directed DNA polymerase